MKKHSDKINEQCDKLEQKLHQLNENEFEQDEMRRSAQITVGPDDADSSMYIVNIRVAGKPEEVKEFYNKQKAISYASNKQSQLNKIGIAAEVIDLEQ